MIVYRILWLPLLHTNSPAPVRWSTSAVQLEAYQKGVSEQHLVWLKTGANKTITSAASTHGWFRRLYECGRSAQNDRQSSNSIVRIVEWPTLFATLVCGISHSVPKNSLSTHWSVLDPHLLRKFLEFFTNLVRSYQPLSHLMISTAIHVTRLYSRTGQVSVARTATKHFL